MNKQKILKELNDKRNKKILISGGDKNNLIPEDCLQIAIKGSKTFYQNLMLFKDYKSFYIVLYDKRLPSSLEIINCHCKKGLWDVIKIDEESYRILKNSIAITKEHFNYHINPYTSLIMLCLIQGVDLVEKGIIDL